MPSAIFIALVIAVSDGDTLTVLHDRQQVKIRLAEIDAPEKGQPFGARAKQSLSVLCSGKQAEVRPITKDIYRRTVARVNCGGKDASSEQVRLGMAWVYDRYVMDESLYLLQNEARSTRLGLWATPSQVPPWMWRKAAKTPSF